MDRQLGRHWALQNSISTRAPAGPGCRNTPATCQGIRYSPSSPKDSALEINLPREQIKPKLVCIGFDCQAWHLCHMYQTLCFLPPLRCASRL